MGWDKDFSELLGAPKHEAEGHEQAMTAKGAHGNSALSSIRELSNAQLRGQQYDDSLSRNREQPATYTETRTVTREPGPYLDYS